MDFRLLLLKHNPDAMCNLPYPFVEEFYYPNKSRIIPNIATDIIPFIYHLHRFSSVLEQMMHAVKPGQRHCVIEQHLQY